MKQSIQVATVQFCHRAPFSSAIELMTSNITYRLWKNSFIRLENSV
nr:hypothetical protein [Xenorhabdus sp. KK7.4]